MPQRNQELLRKRRTICKTLRLKEENIRFILLALFLYIYLAIGALVFQTVEEPEENNLRSNFLRLYNNVVYKLANGSAMERGPEGLSLDNIHELLYAYGNATKAGVLFKRRRWDYLGSFHFTWTIVSTIGYGATTPMTTLGKLLIIPYGFFGCASGLLFFNLFLERIITFLASCMRFYRIQRQKRRAFIYGGAGVGGDVWGGRRSSQSSTGEGQEEADWKPSVYWVMVCLVLMSASVIFSSAAMFTSMENWTFTDSIYFCFVSYATIGFGDFVSLQQPNYGPYETFYRSSAFVLMVFGCCCLYSLLNVLSIVIKESLNYLIRKLDFDSLKCSCFRCEDSMRRRLSVKRKRGSKGKSSSDRSSCHIAILKTRSQVAESHPGAQSSLHNSCLDLDERRYSGENMISIRGELNNKVSLAVMQKRLYETAQMSKISSHEAECSVKPVGPLALAIVSEKLGDNKG